MRVAAPSPSTAAPRPAQQSVAAVSPHRILRLRRSGDHRIAQRTTPWTLLHRRLAGPPAPPGSAKLLATAAQSAPTDACPGPPCACNTGSARLATARAADSTPPATTSSFQILRPDLQPLRGCAGDEHAPQTRMIGSSCIQSIMRSIPAKVWPCPNGYSQAFLFT